MNRDEMDDILRKTLDDAKLSRGEKRALGEVLDDLSPSVDELNRLRNRSFDLAREQMTGTDNLEVVGWLEEVVKVIVNASKGPVDAGVAEAYFMPGDDGAAKIERLFRGASSTVDVCVFTITDNRLARALIDAHRRGVKIRVISDDEKAFDRGSDIDWIHDAGVGVRTDRSESHMHHKFAIFDKKLLLTGSYNWTRGAARDNQENFVVVDDARLIRSYSETFEKLWHQFA